MRISRWNRLENWHVSRPIINLATALAILLMTCTLLAQEEGEEEEIREYDHILIKGAAQPLIGTIVRTTETHVYVRLRDYNTDIDTPVSREVIAEIKRRTTPLQAFLARRSKVGVGEFRACYDVARWSLQFSELREKTKETLRDCIKINAKFTDAYILLSDLLCEEYRQSGPASEEQLSALIEMYQHAIASGAEDPRIYYRLGLALRKVKLTGASLRAFRDTVKANEDAGIPEIGTWARQEAGEVLVELGKLDEALAEFESVLADSPDDFRSLLGKGEALLVLGRLDEAGAALTRAATIDAYYPKPFMLLGVVAYMKGELADSEVWLGRALAVSLPDPSALTALSLVHARLGRYRSAATELAQALTANPGFWQAELARGYLAENEGKPQDAISAYLRALQVKDTSGIVHFKLAGAYHVIGEKDSAINELYLSLENGYRPVEVFKLLGRIEYESENYAVAARHLRYAIAAEDKDSDAHYMLAMCCLKLGLDRLAQKHFRTAGDHDPGHVGAFNGLGYLAYRSGSFKEATAMFAKAQMADPKNAYASEGLAMINQILNWDRWEDTFKRPDSDDVSNGWVEENDARYGIEMRIETNSVYFKGKQKEAGKKAFLMRTENGRDFVRIEALLNGLQAAGARFGIRIEKRDNKGEIVGAVVLMRDVDGSLTYNYTEEKGKWKSIDMPMVIEPYPVDTESHRFALGIVDYATGTVELLFDGRKVEQVTCTPLARAKEVIVGIYGSADAGVPWTLTLEEVSIFRHKSEAEKGKSGF